MFNANRLPPKPEHIAGVLAALEGDLQLSPMQISAKSGLTLTQVNCALNKLEATGKVVVTEQEGNKRPKQVVSLATQDK